MNQSIRRPLIIMILFCICLLFSPGISLASSGKDSYGWALFVSGRVETSSNAKVKIKGSHRLIRKKNENHLQLRPGSQVEFTVKLDKKKANMPILLDLATPDGQKAQIRLEVNDKKITDFFFAQPPYHSIGFEAAKFLEPGNNRIKLSMIEGNVLWLRSIYLSPSGSFHKASLKLLKDFKGGWVRILAIILCIIALVLVYIFGDRLKKYFKYFDDYRWSLNLILCSLFIMLVALAGAFELFPSTIVWVGTSFLLVIIVILINRKKDKIFASFGRITYNKENKTKLWVGVIFGFFLLIAVIILLSPYLQSYSKMTTNNISVDYSSGSPKGDLKTQEIECSIQSDSEQSGEKDDSNYHLLLSNPGKSQVLGKFQKKMDQQNTIVQFEARTGEEITGKIAPEFFPRVGLRIFSGNTKLIVSPTDDGIANIRKSLSNISCDNATNIGAALKGAGKDLSGIEGSKLIVLISDGEGNNPPADIASAYELANSMPDLRADVISIYEPGFVDRFLGIDGGKRELEELARILRGSFIRTTASNLDKTLQSSLPHVLEGGASNEVLPFSSRSGEIKNIVLLLDVSYSMQGNKLRKAKNAIRQYLDSLEKMAKGDNNLRSTFVLNVNNEFSSSSVFSFPNYVILGTNINKYAKSGDNILNIKLDEKARETLWIRNIEISSTPSFVEPYVLKLNRYHSYVKWLLLILGIIASLSLVVVMYQLIGTLLEKKLSLTTQSLISVGTGGLVLFLWILYLFGVYWMVVLLALLAYASFFFASHWLFQAG